MRNFLISSETLHAVRIWWKTWRTFPVKAWIYGAKLYQAGKFEKAAKHFEKGIIQYPNHPARYAAQLDLAYCHFKSMEFVKSELSLKEIILAYPKLLEAHLLLVRLYLWTGRPTLALTHVSLHIRALAYSPELTTLYLMACIEDGTSGYLLQEAIYFFTKRANIGQITSGSTLDLLCKTAEAMLQHYFGEETESTKNLNQIVSSGCPPVEAFIQLSYIYIKQLRYEEALGLLRRALRASPRNPNISLALSRCYLSIKAKESVEYAIQHAMSACQASGWLSNQALWVLTEAYIQQGNFIDAALVARKALGDEGADLLKDKKTDVLESSGILKKSGTDSSRLDH